MLEAYIGRYEQALRFRRLWELRDAELFNRVVASRMKGVALAESDQRLGPSLPYAIFFKGKAGIR